MIETFQFVFSWIAESRWAWVAEVSALVLLAVTTVVIVAAGLYSRPVQRLLSDLKKISLVVAARARDASASPYDRNPEDIRLVAWCIVVWYYLVGAVMFLYGMPFILIFSGFYGPEGLPFYKRFIALAVAISIWFFGRLMKVEGDKLLFKLRSK